MSDDLKKVGDIEINQDLDFQRAEWKVQRAGWIVLLVIAIAALAGAFGDGPIARAHARGRGDLLVDYDRIVRHGAPVRINAHLERAQGEVGITFPKDYIEHAEVTAITPEPERSETGNGGLTFFFQLQPNATIHFQFKPIRMGNRNIRLTATNGAVVEFRQFVLP